MEFASEGFDLDALAASTPSENGNTGASSSGDDVVYEIGGGVSRLRVENNENENEKKETSSPPNETDKDDDNKEEEEEAQIMKQAQEYKVQGNQAFLAQNWLEAYDMYTQAIQATPGPLTGQEMLKQRNEWRAKENGRARRALAKQEQKRQDEEKMKKKSNNQEEGNASSSSPSPNNSTPTATTTDDKTNKDDDPESAPTVFEAPPHPYGKKYLSIYHCNRAAALLPLERYDEAIQDCDIALLWNPIYTKALVRRAKAQEATEHYDLAIADLKQALELETTNAKARFQYQSTLKRLERLEAERMEQLKAETMDKLKDLGNSILGNFGLSLDNFKAVQDPNTGSYSISFDQNNNDNKNAAAGGQ